MRLWPWSRFHSQDEEIRRLKKRIGVIERHDLAHNVRKKNREFWLLKIVPSMAALAVSFMTIGTILHWF